MFHVKPALWDLNDLLTGLRKMAEKVARSPAHELWYHGLELVDGTEYLRRLEREHESVILAYLVWMPDTLCGDQGRCLLPPGHFPMTLHGDALSQWPDRFQVAARRNVGQPWR